MEGRDRLFKSGWIRVMGFTAMYVLVLSIAQIGWSRPVPQQAPSGGIQILTTKVDDAIAGAPYISGAFEASGGKFPYTWSAKGLPGGLSFGTSDVIHGSTDQVGSFDVVVTVIDNSKPTPLSATGNFKIVVLPKRDTRK
jgi:hypothetical protein